jgi:DNA polymerase III delta prime subunit
MNTIDLNYFLNRKEEISKITKILASFEENKNNPLFKKGIYIYGSPGIGKTVFITDLLKSLNYDVIKYDAGDIRNKLIIDTITKHNMSDKNIMSLFQKQVKKIVIIMDEIDGMNNGDKGGINTLIKLIRPKKTKKQRLEDVTLNPIICIGNYHVDKKIKELMKVCNVVELKTPTDQQILNIINEIMPCMETELKTNVIKFIEGDIRKLKNIYDIYLNNKHVLQNNIVRNIFQTKSHNNDTKQIAQSLIQHPYSIDHHLNIMNETDRTIVGLLWHENIIDSLSKMKKEVSIPFYLKVLDNICLADYIDRITFQKQIWQFNELSSLIKTFKNNKLYHDTFTKKPNKKSKQNNDPPSFTNATTNTNVNTSGAEIRFTKVLTKYSTEYNNAIFIQSLCQQLGMDKKDLFYFFIDLKNTCEDDAKILALFENYEITKLDINRIYRYLDKFTKETAADIEDICDDISIE